MGTIYKKKWKDKAGNQKESKTWWIKYYRRGKPYFENTKTDKKMVATEILKQREGDLAKGKLPGVHFDRVTFEDLSKDFLQDYRLNQRKSLERAEVSLKHLKKHFGDFKVPHITTPEIQTYIEDRLEDGAANGTINRELSALKRILNLGARQYPPKVNRVPFIPMLKEKNVRKGFFKHKEYLALLKALPSYLGPVVIFAYKTGWRKSEILGLTWDRVDFKEGTVRLETDETKNSESRTIYLDEALIKLLRIQKMRKGEHCSHVFQRDGKPIKDFRGAWKKACEDIDIEGKIFHDLRRTGVRNMVRAGIQERVAMKISGHKTRAVFDRYNIVSAEDLRKAAMKIGEHEKMVTKEQKNENTTDDHTLQLIKIKGKK